MGLKEKVLQIPFVKSWKIRQQKKNFKGSAEYWEARYRQHGNSGSGSYQHLAEFKAEILNEFVAKHNISSVLEFGCGDGNQLTLAKYPEYVGLDVSATAIQMCIDLFKNDRSKSFYLYNTKAFQDHAGLFKADLALSLDVLFHLVEPEIFELYLRQLFESSRKYVIIYASDFNHEGEQIYQHDRRRNFTAFVNKNISGWKLLEVIKNKYPVKQYNEKGSFSDFYIYEKL
jgi:SAM-dependent methyltransferase